MLPTDPAYLQLNFFQKLILLSFISDKEVKDVDTVKIILEYMKPYMNLELYKYEKDQESGAKNDREIVNVAFEYQSKVGRATGRAQSPKWVREALLKHFAQLDARKPKKVVWSQDPSTLG